MKPQIYLSGISAEQLAALNLAFEKGETPNLNEFDEKSKSQILDFFHKYESIRGFDQLKPVGPFRPNPTPVPPPNQYYRTVGGDRVPTNIEPSWNMYLEQSGLAVFDLFWVTIEEVSPNNFKAIITLNDITRRISHKVLEDIFVPENNGDKLETTHLYKIYLEPEPQPTVASSIDFMVGNPDFLFLAPWNNQLPASAEDILNLNQRIKGYRIGDD